ncbi:MAG: SDH family Clp fold serine proteinase [Terriglobia bacterium]
MARQDRIELIRKIEEPRGSRLICCLTSDRQNAQGVVAKDFIPVFFNHLSEFQDLKKVDVFMFTEGGDTLAAFGLSRLLREFTDSVQALVPEKCYSAGTLFILGTNQIFMSKAATLTPIDPSVSGPLNPVVEVAPGQRQLLPVSVESVAGYRTLAREDWRLNDEAAGVAFRLLAERINPLALGDVYRSRQQIERLARKLLNYHHKDERNIQNIVEQLTRDLGSHDYLISRGEARDLLGSQVAGDDAGLEELIWKLFLDFKEEMKLGQVFEPGMVIHAARERLPIVDEQKLVVVESGAAGDVFERTIQLSLVQAMTPAGPMQTPQMTLVRQGWKRYN